MNKKALVFGGSGLVGQQLLQALEASSDFTSFAVFGRRDLPGLSAKAQQHRIDFSQPESYRALLQGEVVFCCLGTTMKAAGSKAAFRQVDYTYPLDIGQMAREAGIGQFIVVSAAGADPRSLFFYSQVKGEMEQALEALKFPQLAMLQPSLLLGERQESRLGEGIAQRVMPWIAPAFIGPLRDYRPIEARTVALAMLALARQPQKSGRFGTAALEELGSEGEA